MPSFAGFKDLNDYLTKRCREKGLAFHGLSEELGFSHSYIHGIAHDNFEPSKKRIDKIAKFFDDNPKVVRIIAGLELPPTDEDKEVVELKELIGALPTAGKKELLEYAHFLVRKHKS